MKQMGLVMAWRSTEVLRALAVALAVSADDLVFDPDEPVGAEAVIEGALLRHQARRLAQIS